MKRVFAVVLIVIVAMLLFACEESERNQIGSSIDWGPNHYWNSSTESVEELPW